MQRKIWLIILTILVTLSLVLNGVLLLALFKVRHQTLDTLAAVRNTVMLMGVNPITTTVHVDQTIPFNVVIPLNETITVPLDIVYPLTTVVNTFVDIPVLGRQDIALPINTQIPIQYDLTVPIALDIPISLTYPLKLDVPVAVEIPPELRAPIDAVLQQIEFALR